MPCRAQSLSAKDFGHIDVKKEVAGALWPARARAVALYARGHAVTTGTCARDADMSARGVMASIARIIANAASSIMSGKGLGYMVPSRK